MATTAPVRLEYRIQRMARLHGVIEDDDLLWYETVYVTERMRGYGLAKWLFAQSIRDFHGRIEVDVLDGVAALPSIFTALRFRKCGRSSRYQNCSLWRFDPHGRKFVKPLRFTMLGQPRLVRRLSRPTARYLWKTRIYQLDAKLAR